MKTSLTTRQKAPKSTHITPILKSLHWLTVNERIEYKLIPINTQANGLGLNGE